MGKKILFINQEIAPFVPDSTMAIIGRDLPQYVQEQGNELRTFMPKWGNINERRCSLHEVKRLLGINIIINDTDHPLLIKAASVPQSRLQVYFIDNDEFFLRRKVDETPTTEHKAECAIFFARAVLETVKKLRWVPDIIHCQGWMCAAVPFYIKTAFNEEPSFADTKIVSTLFSEGLEGKLTGNYKESIAYRDIKPEMLKVYADDFDLLELSKLALDYSDGIILGDAGISSEIVDRATQKGKPTVSFSDDIIAKCPAFYETL